MFFLLRMAFWLGVVCVLLSSGGKSTSPEAQIDAAQAVTLASAAVTDVRGFCERQPDACEAGGKVAVAIGHKAEAGARTLYESSSASCARSTEKADGKVRRQDRVPASWPAKATRPPPAAWHPAP